MTQAVQSWDDPVPLLADKPALLRVFVTAPQDATVTMPDVRATFYVDGTERHTVLIPASTRTIPSVVTEGELEASANAEIPEWVIVPGLEMVVDVDPSGTLDSALGVTKRIPERDRLAVDVQRVPPFHLTLVPFLSDSEPDSSVVESIPEMAADPGGHELLRGVRTMLPVERFDVTAREPVISSAVPTSTVVGLQTAQLLAQLWAIRIMEGGSGHWMGIFGSPVGSGLAKVGGPLSVSVPDARIIAHELGHNFGLLHAPCGFPDSVDPWFPHANGGIGSWGYDFERDALVGPRFVDLMSYCTYAPHWISDFFFNKALDNRLADGRSAASPTTAEANPVRSLLLWGGRDEDGIPYLDPAFVVDAAPSLPGAGGEYTVRGATADGTDLFSLAFGFPAIGDAEGAEASFVFALPVQPGWEDNLASITLSGPGGSAILDDSTDRPMAILRDPGTGQVRAFLRDPAFLTQTAADAVGQAAGPQLETLFSRGIPGAEAWRR